MRKQLKNKKQFTLIELIIVIVVIGILAAMALPKFTGVIRNGHVAAMEQDLDIIEKAVMQYVMATDDGSYPFVDINEDTKINEEDLYFKTGTIPQTLTDTLLKTNGDDGSKIYKLDMNKLKPYINNLKYPDTEYVYSPNSDTAIDPIGKPDGDNNIHHIIGGGIIGDNSNNSQSSIFLVRNNNLTIGYHNSIYLGEDNNVYATGVLDETKFSPITTYSKLTTSNDVKSIVTGYRHMAYINTNGEVYTLGNNQNKQLGRVTPSENNISFGLAKLPDGVKAVDVKVTNYSTLVLDEKGDLYICGLNSFLSLEKYPGNIDTFQKLGLPNGLKAKSIEAAPYFISVIDEKGNVHTIGGNSYVSSINNKWTTHNFDNPIIRVVLLESDIIVIDNKGNLYGLGRNDYGQLGLGDSLRRDKFEKITLPNNIVPKSIEGVRQTLLILTKDNELYGCGENVYGILSSDSNYTIKNPIKIIFDGINKVNKLYSSNNSNTQSFIFEDDKGILYGTGYNGCGQLGVGDTNSYTHKLHTINLPIKIKN